ncbi:KUP/HAK/KT family potassium transporter [Micrococcus porci]|uniref:potassium transporter Kup n=1 Tax=Micrococcus porci TaxID=2856555 RepID=UPI001CCBE162|nr:KUP/HAK/KT family potassium transporter [Micrococcus porci]UBH25390.1 KUP/HAK/KT family potassium transporter [Micrococcus porci]
MSTHPHPGDGAGIAASAAPQPAPGSPSSPAPTAPSSADRSGGHAAPGHRPATAERARTGMLMLAIGALGVVFGDIGTSPLYALQTLFSADHNAVTPSFAHVTGAISLVLWSLILIVTLTYVLNVLRADHHGEGGVLSLATLVRRHYDEATTPDSDTDVAQDAAAPGPERRRRGQWAFTAGLIGCSFFFGDSVITPAISVMSAVEGVAVAVPSLEHWIIPASLLILIVLYGLQRFGTGGVGMLFGPVMAAWFATLAVLGVGPLLDRPDILVALSPLPGLMFALQQPMVALVAMGAVVLAVTGAEALYADIGHFGRLPISRDWLFFVLPALALNYLGQGALILDDPGAVANPFFRLAPDWFALPLTILAIAATVIASQAVITGAYSVTRQAMRLGYLPPLAVRHTSGKEAGQVYLPLVNWILLAAVVLVVLMFRSSVALATAYGLAVTVTMIITTTLVLVHMATTWRRPLWQPVLLGTLVLPLELSFLAGNLVKVFEGGWLPLTIGGLVLGTMTVWHRGRVAVSHRWSRTEADLETFMAKAAHHVETGDLRRVPGHAVYLAPSARLAPAALRINLRANRGVHEKITLVHVVTEEQPYVAEAERCTVREVGPLSGVHQAVIRVGFFDALDIPGTLRAHAAALGLTNRDLVQAVYVLSRSRYLTPRGHGPKTWGTRAFVSLSRLADQPVWQYGLPVDHTLEVGSRVRL